MNLSITKDWSLFLDRDGVINVRIVGDYVKNPQNFVFTNGTIEAVAKASSLFGRIFVVTNQQGIGKGLMTPHDLELIHKHMQSQIEDAGGKIDQIYACPFLKEAHSFLRKPQVGMGLQAKKDFPEINFKKSIMVGDSISDMEFGKRLGMKTVFISDDLSKTSLHYKIIDYRFHTLADFIEALQ